MLMICFPFAGGHARLLHDRIDRDTYRDLDDENQYACD